MPLCKGRALPRNSRHTAGSASQRETNALRLSRQRSRSARWPARLLLVPPLVPPLPRQWRTSPTNTCRPTRPCLCRTCRQASMGTRSPTSLAGSPGSGKCVWCPVAAWRLSSTRTKRAPLRPRRARSAWSWATTAARAARRASRSRTSGSSLHNFLGFVYSTASRWRLAACDLRLATCDSPVPLHTGH